MVLIGWGGWLGVVWFLGYIEIFEKTGIMEGVQNWCMHRIVIILGSFLARYVGNHIYNFICWVGGGG